MATKQFISLENLSLFKDLIEQVIAEGDRPSIKAAALNGSKKLELYTIENPTAQDTPRYSITLPFTEQEIVTANGKAIVWNEASGGGAKFESVDNNWSAVCVNDGGANGISAQIYSVDSTTKKGTRINVTTSGIYYTNGKTSPAFTADDELATKGDLAGGAGAKTVYVVESTGGSSDPFSKKYDFYQGNGSAQSPIPSEQITSIAIAKDMFVESGTVGTVVTPNVPYEGAAVGDKYIDLTLANSSSDHIYIPANSLVDIYTGYVGTEITIAIDSNNQISATLTAVDGAKLVDGTVTKAKLAQGVQDSLDLADSSLQDSDITSVDDADIEALFE